MDGYRSKSYKDDRMQMQRYYGSTTMASSYSYNDFRSYSAPYVPSSSSYGIGGGGVVGGAPPPSGMKGWKLKKSNNSRGAGSTLKSWSFNDPESQRKRRVASYKVYTVEGKIKGSLRKSFRWLKYKYSQVIYG